ncbi:DUF2493 domain-containing protein [Faecalicatena sp. BF-R-105]|nr:DUF2493 domain-containing protein [Faecalicatena sp. BF-R-105]
MAVEGSNIHKNTDGVFRVIVAGSRDFNDYNLLSITLDRLLQNVQEKLWLCAEKHAAPTRLENVMRKLVGIMLILTPLIGIGMGGRRDI